jgi:iron(III) transport system permease protein
VTVAAGRRRFPWILTASSIAIVAALLAPLVLVVVQAAQSGWSNVWEVLDRSYVATLLWNTVRLAAVVTVLAAIIGTGAAWLTERTALPGRRLWAVLLIVPVVIPDFVLSWSWSSVFDAVHGFNGAVLVMTLHLYPLVYLPMAGAFRSADPGQEEAARGLGLSRWRVWWRISVRQARATLLGGCLLVCLALLSYYGAFENLRYQTFTTAIFGELQTQFAPGVASSMSLVLVAISLFVLGGEAVFRERGRVDRTGPLAQRALAPIPLTGIRKALALAGIVALVALALSRSASWRTGWWWGSRRVCRPRCHSARPSATRFGTARSPRRSQPRWRCRWRCSRRATAGAGRPRSNARRSWCRRSPVWWWGSRSSFSPVATCSRSTRAPSYSWRPTP